MDSLWVCCDADGLTWMTKAEPVDFNGRTWDLGGEGSQWVRPEMFNLEPGTKCRLLMVETADAAGVSTTASTSGATTEPSTATL